jgi:hypothetical protein
LGYFFDEATRTIDKNNAVMYTTKTACGLSELHGKAKRVRLSRLSNQGAERRFMADNKPDTAAMNRAGNKKE